MGKRDKDGPSANQLRGLTYNDNKPKFLRNIATALAGPQDPRSSSSNRPPIPERPEDDPNGDVPSDEEDNFGRMGDEAPQIVVLKEGRHLSQAEAEEAKKSAPSPGTVTDSGPARKGASLRFSSKDASSKSGGNLKRKIHTTDADEDEAADGPHESNDAGGSFDDLVKRTKTQTDSIPSQSGVSHEDVAASEESLVSAEQKKKAPLTKEEKAAMKAKRKAAKKMLSFED